MRSGLLIGALCLMTIAMASKAYGDEKSEATITSDEAEMRNNGEETFFRGHVVLTQEPYVLHADEMTRTKSTGIVIAHGHLDGNYISSKGEHMKLFGTDGRYTPSVPLTEVWGDNAELIRWETEQDSAPIHVRADRFMAYHDNRQFYALGHVVITQAPKALAKSDKANFDQKAGVIHLYGPTRVFVHIEDGKGSGDFTGDKGWLTLDPKTAHLAGQVKGHVIPS